MKLKCGVTIICMGAGLALGADARAGEGGAVTVEVHGIASDKGGEVGCALFEGSDGFPSDIAKAVQRTRVAVQSDVVRCTFTGVPPGDYAVSVTHDENGDGKMNKNFLGFPKEGWGVSRDAPASFGPPKFDKAKVRVESGTTQLRIAMRY
jgi:uncharacterized protein (DUF2141 family)